MADNTELLMEMRKMTGFMSQVAAFMNPENAAGGTGNSGADGGSVRNAQKPSDLKKESKVFDHFSKIIEKSGDSVARAAVRSMTSMADFEKFQDQNKDEIDKVLKEQAAAYKNNKITHDEYARSVAKFGFAVEKGATVDIPAFNKSLETQADAMAAAQGHITILDRLKEKFKVLDMATAATNLALAGLKEGIDVGVVTLERSAKVTANQILKSRMMGMSHVELINHQADYRDIISASGQTTNEFTDNMQQSSLALLRYTGDLKAGALIYSKQVKLFQLVGGEIGGSLSEFQKGLNASNKEFSDNTGVSLERQAEETSLLLQNEAVQKNLFKMAKGQRQAYLMQINDSKNFLTTLNLSTEQAIKFAHTLEEMAGGTAKDRISEAAKLEAVAGAMGMGDLGAELGALHLKGNANMDAAEKQRYAELVQQFQEGSQGGAAQGLGFELVFDRLLSEIGFLSNAETQRMAVQELGDGKKPKEPPNPTWVEDLMTFGVLMRQWGEQVPGSVRDAILAAGALLGGSKLLTSLGGLTKIGPAISQVTKTAVSRIGIQLGAMSASSVAGISAASTAGGTLMGTASAAAITTATAGLPLALAGATGVAIGTVVNAGINKWFPDVGDAIGGTVNELVESFHDKSLITDAVDYWGSAFNDIFSSSVNDGEDPAVTITRGQRKHAEKIAEKEIAELDAQARVLEDTMMVNKNMLEELVKLRLLTDKTKELDEKSLEMSEIANAELLKETKRAGTRRSRR